MRKLIHYLKNSLHTIGAIVAILIVAMYVSAQFNLNGLLTKKLFTEDLSKLLGTEVSLENATVDIFNQVTLDNLLIKDLQKDTLFYARRAMVSFDLFPLIQKKLQIHTLSLIDFDLNLNQKDSLLDSNFQFILDIIAPKDQDNNRQIIDNFNINSIFLRSGTIAYDNYTKKRNDDFFDPNHLFLDNVSASLKISSSLEEGLYVRLKRISFDDKSGLSIKKASSIILLDSDADELNINDINIACTQTLNKRYKIDSNCLGFASLNKDSLNFSLVSLDLKTPNHVDIHVSANGKDVLRSGNEKFNASIDKCFVSSDIISYFTDKFSTSDTKLAHRYLDEISDINLNAEVEGSSQNFEYNANIETFGTLSSELNVNGIYNKENPVNIVLEGFANNIELNKYKYGNLSFVGRVNNEKFDADFSIDDPNCDVDANVTFYYKDKLKKADVIANIINFEPFALNLTNLKNLEDVRLSAEIDGDLNLNKIKRPVGKIKIDSLKLTKSQESYFIPEIIAEALLSDETYLANVNSPILSGNFVLENDFAEVLADFPESRSLSEFLQLPFSINENANVNLRLGFQESENEKSKLKFDLQAIENAKIFAPNVQYKDNNFFVELLSEKKEEKLVHNLNLKYKVDDNNISTKLRASTTANPLSLEVDPCTIQLNKDLIKCDGIKVEQREDNNFDLTKLKLALDEQKIDVSGIITENSKFDLLAKVEQLKMDTLFTFLDNEYVMFGGTATGEIAFVNDSTMYINSENLFVKDFSYLNGNLGDTDVKANYDLTTDELNIKADIACADNHTTIIEGYVNCGAQDSLDLHFDANKLNLEFIKIWVGGFLEDFHGDITGLLHLYGPGNKLKLIGEPYTDASFTHHMSGSRFYLKDYISLYKDEDSDNSHIDLNNAKLFDKLGNEAVLNASVNHRHFNHFIYDVRIDLPSPNGFLVFDQPTHYNNELYWGQIFGSGNITFQGKGNKHDIKIFCQTRGKSQLNLSPGEESYSDKGYSFLTFRDKKKFLESENFDYSHHNFDFIETTNTKSNTQSVDLELRTQITENCQVYVQMDPLAEDRLLCKGNGDVVIHYDPKGNVTISGEYNMTSGGYLVTMKGDLLNKEFKIQNGSKIVFPGNFSDAELTLNANYSIPSVNLKDLDESFTTLASLNRTTFPVDCKLSVTGQISAPQVGFDLEVKNTSDDVQALVHNIIATPDMLNQEVFYLLLFSKFYTPDYANTSQNNSGSELSSFASSSLTSQLNNILASISDNFTLGTNFHSDKGDFSDVDVDVSLSTTLFNDRLILNGNLGYRDPSNRVGLRSSTNSFIGDFDVEYMINRTGTLRAKAYSHYNERDYSINNALTTQGIGFIMRKDFKTLKDLYFWRPKTFKKDK